MICLYRFKRGDGKHMCVRAKHYGRRCGLIRAIACVIKDLIKSAQARIARR